MATTATNVSAGKPKIGGAIFCAPKGTTLPTSATGALDESFVSLGYVSEDGLTHDNSPESDSVKAWGGDTVLTLQTDRPDSYGFTLLEVMNKDVLKVVYGDGNVTEVDGEIVVKATPEQLEGKSWVIDMVLRGGVAKRIVIPDGTVTEVGTITYSDSDAIGYELTVTDVPDTNGVYHYEYFSAAEVSG